MPNTLCLLTIATSFFISSVAQGSANALPEEAALQVERALTNGDFNAAYAIWKNAAALSTRACFNAGVYALHQGDTATAQAYFTRAAADDTYTVRLAAMRYLRATGTYSTAHMILQACLAAPSWLWVFFALLLALGTLYKQSGSPFSAIWRALCICGVFGCLYQYQYGIQVPAVIVRESVLLAGPGNAFTARATLATGQKITVLKQQDTWTLITNGTHTGWVTQDHIIC